MNVRIFHFVIGVRKKIGKTFLFCNMNIFFYCGSLRCATTYECEHENHRINRLSMCTHIERVIPQTIPLHDLNTEVIRFSMNSSCFVIFDFVIVTSDF